MVLIQVTIDSHDNSEQDLTPPPSPFPPHPPVDKHTNPDPPSHLCCYHLIARPTGTSTNSLRVTADHGFYTRPSLTFGEPPFTDHTLTTPMLPQRLPTPPEPSARSSRRVRGLPAEFHLSPSDLLRPDKSLAVTALLSTMPGIHTNAESDILSTLHTNSDHCTSTIVDDYRVNS